MGSAGAGELSLSAASVSASAYYGAVPATQNVTLSNVGNAPVAWTLSDDVAWADVTPTSGNLAAGASQAIAVAFSDSTLAVGPHTGTVTIVGANGASIALSRTVDYLPLAEPTVVQCMDAANLYQDAAKTTPATATGPIGAWAATVGVDLVQSNAGLRPTRSTLSGSGLPAVLTDASDDYLRSASTLPRSLECAWFAVIEPAAGFFMFELGNPSYTDSPGGGALKGITGTTAAVLVAKLPDASPYLIATASANWAGTSPCVVTLWLRNNGTNYTISARRNGVQAAVATGSVAGASSGYLSVGARVGPQWPAACKYAEFVMLDSTTPGTIDAAAVARVESYLMTKYGIS